MRLPSLTTSTLLVATLLATTVLAGDGWSRFRGPDGSGAIAGPPVPESWSAEKNLRWRTPLPGKGSSSPVVDARCVYVTSYTGYGLDARDPGKPESLVRHVLAFDRASGKEVWRASVPSSADEDPYRGFITQHGYASSTPATDGEHVYAVLGKSGLFAFDDEGKQVWRAELGTRSDPARWGDGSSPIVVGDTVVVDAGVLGRQFVAVDRRSGERRWTLEDSGFTSCWSTPTTVRVEDRTQLLFQVPKRILGVDPRDGKLLWSASSPVDDAACGSVVARDGVAYLMGSRAGNGLAVRYGGSGDVSETHTVWRKRLRSGIATPLIVGDAMYWSTSGIFYAADLATGEYVFRERLPRLGGATGGFPNADYASPIAVGNRIIQLTRSGESYVIEPGDSFRLVAHNPAFPDDDGAFNATPAADGGTLFLRSERFLYAIAKSEREKRRL